MSMLRELEELVEEAASSHGIKEYNLEIRSGSNPGDNYLGELNAIKLSENNGNKSIHLILKIAPTDENVRSRRPILAAFRREYDLYNTVLPTLLEFQMFHSPPDPFKAIPKVYGSTLESGKEAILMEDLTSRGFTVIKHSDAMDFDHMQLVFKEYAKLHVISLALRHKYPEKFEDLTKNIRRNFLEDRKAKNPDHYKNIMKTVLEMGRKAVSEDPSAAEAHKIFEHVLPEFLRRDEEHPEKDVIVITHGDCHPNNILFKYKKQDDIPKPSELCLIDWQLSSTESPIRDLSFLLFACASREAIEKSDDLFETYHGVIAQSLVDYGCVPEEVFSFDTFTKQWEKHYLHGLYRAQMTLKLNLMTKEELAEMGDNSSIFDILKKDFSPECAFSQRMRDVFGVIGDKWWFK